MGAERMALLATSVATLMDSVADLPNSDKVLNAHAEALRRFAAGILAIEGREKTTDAFLLADLRERVSELERRARVEGAHK